MNLLVAEQVNQYQVAVVIFAPKGPRYEMVDVQFLIIEERFKAF